MGKRDNADVDETDCEMFLKSVPCERFPLVRLFDGERERGERERERERLNYLHGGGIRKETGEKGNGIHSLTQRGNFCSRESVRDSCDPARAEPAIGGQLFDRQLGRGRSHGRLSGHASRCGLRGIVRFPATFFFPSSAYSS